jgi:hypothetical protein
MEEALSAQGIPEHLHATLMDKLAGEVFDAGSVFSLAEDDAGNYEVNSHVKEELFPWSALQSATRRAAACQH